MIVKTYVRFRIDRDKVVAVGCDRRGYPFTDAEGLTQYENTHFDAADAAWDLLLRNSSHELRAANQMVEAAKDRLRRAEFELVRAAKLSATINDNYSAWVANGFSCGQPSAPTEADLAIPQTLQPAARLEA